MKKNKFVVILFLIGFITIVPSMSAAAPRFLTENSLYTVDVVISDAYYADLDLDGNLDDIAIFIDLYANFEGRFRATFLLSIELPSGLTHAFLLEAWLNINGVEPVKLKVSTLNTASEAGWYTVNLDGQIRGLPYGSFSTDSSLIFDPPTGTGVGDPARRLQSYKLSIKQGIAQTIDTRDIEILLVIQNDPLAPVSTIAKRIGMSTSSTADRVKRLESSLAFKGVHADLNLNALGLELHDFFYQVKTYKALEFLETTLCYYHPYILYRGRCYGKFSGLYIQYRIPKGGVHYLHRINDELLRAGIISGIEHIQREELEKGVSIKSSLNSWNRSNLCWEFDWRNWEMGYEDIPKTSNKHKPGKPIDLRSFDDLDVKLLAELTRNARQKNIDIIREFGLDGSKTGITQLISRKLSVLKSQAISDYRIFLNWKYFDLYQTIMIKGTCPKETSLQLRNYLLKGVEYGRKEDDIADLKTKTNFFPFQSVFFVRESGFIWYVRAPPSHLSALTDFIWRICPSHDIFTIDYGFSQFYALWVETFDLQNKTWKLNEDFMITRVLDQIK